MKTFYELLELPRSASADDIKKAFRREIARYHPDKVQHLGQEFQEIALAKAAELTQAYQTLSDPSARAEYDAQLDDPEAASPVYAPPPQGGDRADVRPAEPARRAPVPPPPAPPADAPSSVFAQDRAGASDLIQRATVARFRQAVESEFGRYEETRLPGFEVVCIPKPSFWTLRLPPRVLGRFVPHVDAAAVAEAWGLAVRMKKDVQRDLCVFLMAASVAAPGELAAAIAEQRRKPMPAGGKLVLIPVNTRTWSAHVPQDAPPVVKSLLTRLRAA